MSGKFFKHLSDSESESEESEEELAAPKPTGTATYSFSDDEEELKRVVRTAREKRYEELVTLIKQIRNHKKIKDISKMLTGFENLTKAFLKAKNVIDKEESGVTPKFYIKCLVELDDFVNEVWEDREGRKNMSKNNSKSLATLRQKLRKYNKDFELNINNYRENPEECEEEKGDASEEEDQSSDSDVGFVSRVKQPSKLEEDELAEGKREKEVKFLKTGSDDDESDDESWPSSSSESSSSSDDEKYGDNLAARFLKKVQDEGKESKKREKKVKEPKSGKRRDEYDDRDEGEWEKVKGGVATMEKPKMFAKDAEINHPVMVKKLAEVLAMRGKKRIDRTDQIEMLTELYSISEQHNLGPALAVKILFGIISSIYDYNSNMNSCMKHEMWEKCLETAEQVIDILMKNPDISVGENIAEESEIFVAPPYRVHGCVLTLIERMDEEFTKMLQGCDAHSPEYLDRLRDEIRVCRIIEKLQQYFELNERGTASELCRIYILHIDHLYYKFDGSVFLKKKSLQKEAEKSNGENEDEFKKVEIVIEDESGQPINKPEEAPLVTSMDKMDQLCKYIYSRDVTDRIRTQAILCHIYHHALHDNWFEARDLMLMSYLQHNIQKSDIPLQVMYNRALVQLGLCAFRHGTIKDAHTALLDIQIQGRAKELLAQGLLPRQNERTPEQEKQEKRRQIPFHKHINLELLECVYLVSAMLLEIPDVASNEFSIRKKMISRSFYNQLRKNEEQPLVGLPESMREHVVAASKVMRVGNWRQCQEYIINDKMDSKVWNLFYQSERVRDMLRQKIREESLRAYLFTYSNVYDSICIKLLAEMFDLEAPTVHSIISKMIINEELMASLDEPTQTAVMHRTEPSRIQGLSLQLADKINNLVEQNERLWEMKQMTIGQYNTSNRFANDRQYGYQRDKGGYQDRNQRGDKGGYQDRNQRGDKGGYQDRNQRGDKGGYHDRNQYRRGSNDRRGSNRPDRRGDRNN